MSDEKSESRVPRVEPQDVHPYWLRGHEIIEKRLAVAVRARTRDAPVPLVGIEAANWFAAQADAYRDALEMMGVPEEARSALTQEAKSHG